MGYQRGSIEIRARLSRHNDERDDQDDTAFREISERIRKILNDPKYTDIEPEMDGPYL